MSSPPRGPHSASVSLQCYDRQTGREQRGGADRCQKWKNLTVTHSSSLAWKIPWTEEPDRPQSMGSLRVRHDWATSLFTFMHWRMHEMATHSSVLAWEIPGMGEPGGLPSMGRRVGHDWSDLAAAAALRYSCLENSMDRRAWPATVHGVTKSGTWLSD